VNTASFPMPGALRWRVIHHLIDEDGSCPLIYDVERAAVVEVPDELRLHVAPALETGDLDDDLLTWLVDEDLLTTESWAGEPALNSGAGFRWGGIQRFEDEICARIAPSIEDEVETALDAVFRQGAGMARVQLFLDWSGNFPGAPLVERIVVEASQRARAERQEVTFELVLGVRQVTRAVAAFLTTMPIHVRLLCGSFPARDASAEEQRAWEASSVPLVLLLDMADRTTVRCTLAGSASLLDLWSWAKRTGVRHLDAVRSEVFPEDASLQPASRMRGYRVELHAVCDETIAELAAGRIPIDHHPLTRMVRRLMGSEPHMERPKADDLDASPCQACWARNLCNHSSLLAVAWNGDEQEPTPERCAVWLAESEAALRLYHRLAQCDPLDALRLLGDSSRIDPLGRREEPETPRLLF
jgi:hypothetical protein